MSYQQSQVLVIIGARSGSKGIPNKNILPLGGRPLMAWVIDAAKRSAYIDRVIVSTDSESYAALARTWGAETPFLRPAELSRDDSTDLAYITHALTWLREHEGYEPDIVIRAVPTAPLQQPEDFDAVVQKLVLDPEADSAMVIAPARQHPEKVLRVFTDERGRGRVVHYISGQAGDASPRPRQSYPAAYVRANLIASRARVIRNTGTLTGEKIVPYVIPEERSLDIDSMVDVAVGDQLVRTLKVSSS